MDGCGVRIGHTTHDIVTSDSNRRISGVNIGGAINNLKGFYLEGGVLLNNNNKLSYNQNTAIYLNTGGVVAGRSGAVCLKLLAGLLHVDSYNSIHLALELQWKVGYIRTSSCGKRTGFIFY